MVRMTKALISGDFRGWGPIERRQYNRCLGSFQRVGIELEVHNDFREILLELNSKNLIGLSYASAHTEVVKLFNVGNPIKFRQEVFDFYELLSKYDIPTVGSTHVNLQILDKSNSKRYRNCFKLTDNNVKGGKRIFRAEYKKGPVWIDPQELIGGILVIASKRKRIIEYLDSNYKPLLFEYSQLRV